MRLARKLTLLAIAAVAALAMTATTAAADPVEVVSGGQHCSPGPVDCIVEAHGEITTEITAHLNAGPEIITSQCDDEFTAEVNEDGTGHIYNQRLTGAGCPNKPCEATSPTEGDGHEWPFELEEVDTNVASMHVVFCLQAAEEPSEQRECEINVEVTEPSQHHYVFTADDEECAGTPPPIGVRSIEVDGQWEIEGTPIEVIHL